MLLQPFLGRSSSDWYKGTADAVYQNLFYVEESRADQVLILSGDHVYSMHYNGMVAFHREHKADCTVGLVEVPMTEASRYGIVELGERGEVVSFEEKPAKPRSALASMGIYVFERDFLIDRLSEDAEDPKSSHDFGKDILTSLLGRYGLFGFRFNGYWRDVGTIHALWEANMDLLSEPPKLNVNDAEHPILTRSQNRPPAKTGLRAQITRTLTSEGCVINGIVYNSVLSRGVNIEEGAIVEDSVLFDDCHVERGAHIHRAILDKNVRVGQEARIGWGEDWTPNDEEPGHLNTGITVVGKRVHIPPSTRIGRNCKIYPGCQPSAFISDTVPSGKTVRWEPLDKQLAKLLQTR